MKTNLIPPACIEILEARIAPALASPIIWQGDAGSNWGDGTVATNTNWIAFLGGTNKLPVDGSTLTFPDSAANKTNVNNIAGLDLARLNFTGTGYVITGQAITLSNGITANVAAAGTNFFHPTITLAADQTFSSTSAAGAVFKFDTIDLGGNTLTVDGAFTVFLGTTLGTKVTGPGGLIKNGTGTLLLIQPNDFAGPVQVNAGILQIGDGDRLGAAGPGSGTTISSGASLVFLGSTLADDISVSGTGAAGQPGAIVTSSNFATITGALRLNADATISSNPASSSKIILAGAVGAADDALAILTVKPDPTKEVAFAATTTFTTELAGTTPGAGGHDQLKVFGQVDLGGATLNVVPSFTPEVGDKFTIVENDGIDPISGTFAGLPQGATFTAAGVNFSIIYNGGDLNDVVLTVESLVNPPVPVTLSNGGKTATFTDVDGDIVTVKTNKGPFQPTDFRVFGPGVGGGGQFQQINLTTHPGDFTGANLTITAQPGPLGGNGFVNVGYINATGIDLGAVKIVGDLGRINAGTVGGDAKVPALKSLTVESIGLLGTSTQAAGGTLTTNLEGALPKLAVKGDLRDALFFVKGVQDGLLSRATIGGSLVNTQSSGSFILSATAGIGTLKIGGDVRTNSIVFPSSILTEGAIGAITIGGSISADSAAFGVDISAFGKLTAPAAGLDLAIKSVNVKGSVENAVFTAGSVFGKANADASIGAITVGGDWIASRVQAGTVAGTDGRTGTNDDAIFSGTNAHDNPALFSTIGSITIKGQALGTAAAGDMFGIVAERIGKAKVGGRTFAFVAGTNEAFFAAPTGPGDGAENPVFDFTIREIGSATPTVALSVDLDISSDGKTATFTDVDGDLVTAKRSVGTFVLGDFTLSTGASGGGLLKALTVTPAPGNVPVNLSITAKVGPVGGNGFVNVGPIDAGQTDLGVVVIDGELQDLDTGDNDDTRPGLANLTVHSLGSVAGTAPTGDEINSARGIGKITVQTDVRNFHIFANSSDTGNLASITIGGAMFTSEIQAAANIGKIKIGGSFLGDGRIQATERIGTISIGGDLVGGGGTDGTIEAFAQDTGPTKGLDLALKSLTVKGNVEKMNVILGRNNNADASLGTVSVGRAWLASSILAGVEAGVDTFVGTADDQKISQGGPTDLARFSTIASITIKGQALGSTTAGDSFGIVAEQILKAKIGTVKFKFDQGSRDAADAFALSPTGPGPAPDNALSDFFLREITV